MTLFAVTLPHAARGDLTVLAMLYLLISFISVAVYAYRQVRAGQLIGSENAPLPFGIPARTGWLFIGSVVGLIYLQSPLYIMVVPVGMAGILMESGRSVSEQFGLMRLKASQVLGWSLLIYGAVFLVETPLGNVSFWILDALHVPHPLQEAVETFQHYNRASIILVFMLQAVVIQPMIEELFFRGFLLTFLKKYTSTWLALVLSAGVFAFAHVNLGVALPLWFLGLVLGIAYEHTGSLLLPMGIHACFNLVTALSLLLDKGNPS